MDTKTIIILAALALVIFTVCVMVAKKPEASHKPTVKRPKNANTVHKSPAKK